MIAAHTGYQRHPLKRNRGMAAVEVLLSVAVLVVAAITMYLLAEKAVRTYLQVMAVTVGWSYG